MNRLPSASQIEKIRQEATVQCNKEGESIEKIACKPLKAPCLFNVAQDPCELRNLAKV